MSLSNGLLASQEMSVPLNPLPGVETKVYCFTGLLVCWFTDCVAAVWLLCFYDVDLVVGVASCMLARSSLMSPVSASIVAGPPVTNVSLMSPQSACIVAGPTLTNVSLMWPLSACIVAGPQVTNVSLMSTLSVCIVAGPPVTNVLLIPE